MQTVLITGFKGFLGSALTQYLLERNYDVVGLSLDKSKKSKIRQITGDITKLKKIPNGVTDIIHFAAITNIDFCEQNQKKCFEVNVFGTKNMLDLARKNDCNFIFISTSQVFGIPEKTPINENGKLCPLSVYALSKVLGEKLCELYANSYGMNITILRLFSIYGPNSPDYLVTTKIIKQVLQGNKIKIGNVSPKRDFLYVDDLLVCLELLLNKKLRGYNIFNLGSGQSISINTICKKIARISGKQIAVEQDASLVRKNEIYELTCEPSKIEQLGWKPKTPLEKGLSLTYAWFKHMSD